MTHINTRWIDYLHANKAQLDTIDHRLFDVFYEYDLKRFVYVIDEGYRSIDTELENFPSFVFTYVTCLHGHEIEIEVAPGATPVVKLHEDIQLFAHYFGLNASQSEALRAFFETFGQTLFH